MITQLKPSSDISLEFVAADIENRKDGSVITIDTYDGERHYEYPDWNTWLGGMASNAQYDKRFRTIYAHNGGGWDWLSFIEWVLAKNPSQTFHTIENGTRLIAVIVPVDEGPTIKLVDSLFLSGNPPCSLDEWAKKYLGRGKVKLEQLPEWYWENDRETYHKYHRMDTELLYDTICAFGRLLHSKVAPIGKLGMTLPSTALRAFQTAFVPYEVTVPGNETLRAALRSGYVGGRVEVFKCGVYEDIHVYDFNSLYPSVMASTPVPVSGVACNTSRFDPNGCGVYRIRFQQRNRKAKPLLISGGLGVYEGEGWYYTPEIRRLIEMADGKVEVLDGWEFDETGVLFRNYVETLYALRMTDKDGPLGNTCKLLMNSLYGKFGQHPLRSRTIHADADVITEIMEQGHTVDIVNASKGIYRVSELHKTNFEHVGIAGTITSEARGRLWEAFNTGTVYCDTDSVHTTTPISENVGPNLGQLKLEYKGKGVYVGKKLYALDDGKKPKVRAKGVKIGGEFGFPLDFAGLQSLLSGAKIETHFRSGVTAKSVIKGNKACVFVDRKRTIRKTASV